MHLLFNVAEINQELIPIIETQRVLNQFEPVYPMTHVLGHWYRYWIERNHLAFFSPLANDYPLPTLWSTMVLYCVGHPTIADWIERRLYHTIVLPPEQYTHAIDNWSVDLKTLHLQLPNASKRDGGYVRHITDYTRG